MLAIVACLFPALIIGAVFALLPVRIPTESELRGEPYTRQPQPGEEYGYGSMSGLLGAALALPLGYVQATLLAMAGRTEAPFSFRVSDSAAISFLLAFFVGSMVAFPIRFARLKRELGPGLLEVVSRPGRRGYRRMSLGQQLRAFPYEAIAIAVIVTTVNFASFDAFMVITASEMRYSSFLSPRTQRWAILDIQELRVRQVFRAPNGKNVWRPWIEFRFANGQLLDTSRMIEGDDIERAIKAVETSPDFKGRVIRDSQPPRLSRAP
jgi:hypothetical protein